MSRERRPFSVSSQAVGSFKGRGHACLSGGLAVQVGRSRLLLGFSILFLSAGCGGGDLILLLQPSGESVPVGVAVQFKVVDSSGLPVSGTASWKSSDPTIATIDADGVARGLQPGMVTILARTSNAAGATTLTISNAPIVALELSPVSAKAPAEVRVPFSARASYSDGSTHDVSSAVQWTSSDPTIAVVDGTGVAVGKRPGMVQITARASGDGMAPEATATFEVTAAELQTIEVSPAGATVAVGAKRQYAAVAKFSDGSSLEVTATVAWSSSDPAVAEVSNVVGSRGLVTALKPGSAEIVASLPQLRGTASLTVSAASLSSIAIGPPNPSLAQGGTTQLTATAIYSDMSSADVTDQVQWSSSSPAIATVSNLEGSRGLVTALAPGTAVVSATVGGVRATAQITVSAATLASLSITPAATRLPAGTQARLVATAVFSDGTSRDVTDNLQWTSSDAAVAPVSNVTPKGLVTCHQGRDGDHHRRAGRDQGHGDGGGDLGGADVHRGHAHCAGGRQGDPAGVRGDGTYSDGSTRDLTANVTWPPPAPRWQPSPMSRARGAWPPRSPRGKPPSAPPWPA
jgi:uncharacterized protein YjdB